MNTRTVVTIIAATLMSGGFAQMSVAQSSVNSTQDEIEVITIIGKRPASTLAMVCANGVTSAADTVSAHRVGEDEASGKLSGSGAFDVDSSQRVHKHCVEKAAAAPEAQI